MIARNYVTGKRTDDIRIGDTVRFKSIDEQPNLFNKEEMSFLIGSTAKITSIDLNDDYEGVPIVEITDCNAEGGDVSAWTYSLDMFEKITKPRDKLTIEFDELYSS